VREYMSLGKRKKEKRGKPMFWFAPFVGSLSNIREGCGGGEDIYNLSLVSTGSVPAGGHYSILLIPTKDFL